MDLKREHTLFSPSGCLTEDSLLLYKLGMLPEDDIARIDSHLESCELCAAAVEGYGMADAALFSGDVEMLNLGITDMAGKEELEQLHLTGTSEFEGPRFPRLSREEIRDFTQRIHESVPGPETTLKKPARKSVLNRYRTELIAAVLLLLLGIGTRQVYLQLNHTGNNGISDITTPQAEILLEERGDYGIPALPARPQENSDIPSPPAEKKAPELIIVENDVYDTERSVSSELSIAIEDDKNAIPGVEEGVPSLSPASQRETEISSDSFIIKEAQSASYANKQAELKAPLGKNESVAAGKSKNGNRRSEVGDEEVAEAEIFIVVEDSPQFPGGEEAFLRYLSENINYPHEAREASICGTVYITFVIERDGTINDVRVLRGIGGGCDEEAVRVISKMPRWLPGKQRGKPVRVQFNMPIKFSLAG
jgi:TonB family protein